MNSNDEDKDQRKDPFDINDKNKEFERMIHDIEKMMRESLRDIANSKMRPGNSYVHGFNINISPDGKAEVREFGNYPRRKPRRKKQPKEKEAPIDILENKKDISVTIQLPGVTKEDINLNVTDNNREIKVDIPRHKYHKKVALPGKVKPKTTKATYKNGVLDVTIEKKHKKKKGNNYSVDIE